MRSILWSLLSISLIFASCDAAEKEDPLLLKIEELEAEMGEDVQMDTTLAYNLTDAYLRYAEENSQDSLAPYMLMKAANIYKEIRLKWLKAVNVYGQIHHDYPDHELAPEAVFMIGFIFDEKYNDRERAAKSYRYFMETYPQHELYDDAGNLLAIIEDTTAGDNLELIERWMKNNDTLKK